MTKQQVIDMFAIEDLRDLPDAVSMLIGKPLEERNDVYKQLLAVNNYDLSRDWFQDVYETELSERKQKKQDFTPNQVGVLTSLLTGNPNGIVHEPTAGNGSMIIADWWNRCQRLLPWQHFPSEHMVDCWELSARSIPPLLLNLSIRGIMGYVYHGDVLEKNIKERYVLLNRHNDTFGFSEIYKGNYELISLN